MSYIADGEFPDDELTDISYMLESNETYEELFHDLSREDDGPETKVRVGSNHHLLSKVVASLKQEESQGVSYETAVKQYLDD